MEETDQSEEYGAKEHRPEGPNDVIPCDASESLHHSSLNLLIIFQINRQITIK
jgi:hypothetical protein